MTLPYQTVTAAIAAKLASIARSEGYSVARLAREAGIGHGTAQRLMRGESILLDRAQRVADLFGLQIEQWQALTRR